jgi:hypothetical protein
MVACTSFAPSAALKGYEQIFSTCKPGSGEATGFTRACSLTRGAGRVRWPAGHQRLPLTPAATTTATWR